jgi:hypothetical protein
MDAGVSVIEPDYPVIQDHPLFGPGLTSPARSPALAGCVICLGRRWGQAHVDWAARQMARRGPPRTVHQENTFLLQGFREAPLESRVGSARVWTLGLDASEHETAVRLSVAGRLFREGPLALHFGTVVHFDSASDCLEISRGELHAPTFHFAHEGDSLFVAPEIKAFSDVASIEDLRPIARGQAFRFDAGRRSVVVEERPHYWPHVNPTEASYEACQEEMKRLLAEGMAKALSESEGEPVIALSGGLDSGVVAHLAGEAGRKLSAYTVYFGTEGAGISPDLEGARRTAADFSLDLIEIRIGPEEVDELIQEMIYLTEEPRCRDIETGLFVLKLSKTLEARGIRTILMGSKADHLFVSHVDVDWTQWGFEDYRNHLNRRYMMGGMQGKVPPFFGQRVRSPFLYDPLIRFARKLPREYLVDETPQGPRGKRILRDTYGPLLHSPIVHGEKRYPLDTMNFGEFFRKRMGSRQRRQEHYDGLRRRLLRPATLKRRWRWPWRA